MRPQACWVLISDSQLQLSPQGGVGVGGQALLVQEAAVGAAGVVQEGCAVPPPELQHRVQPADARVLQGHLCT